MTRVWLPPFAVAGRRRTRMERRAGLRKDSAMSFTLQKQVDRRIGGRRESSKGVECGRRRSASGGPQSVPIGREGREFRTAEAVGRWFLGRCGKGLRKDLAMSFTLQKQFDRRMGGRPKSSKGVECGREGPAPSAARGGDSVLLEQSAAGSLPGSGLRGAMM